MHASSLLLKQLKQFLWHEKQEEGPGYYFLVSKLKFCKRLSKSNEHYRTYN